VHCVTITVLEFSADISNENLDWDSFDGNIVREKMSWVRFLRSPMQTKCMYVAVTWPNFGSFSCSI
jgi:hypothetical protein